MKVPSASKKVGSRLILRTNESELLRSVVVNLLKKRQRILKVVDSHPTPFYLYDKKEHVQSLRTFYAIFSEKIPNFKPFYALKINQYLPIIREAIKHGYGLDVASGDELITAIQASCTDILYYSPGKTDEELELAIKNSHCVRIQIDSFRELQRIGSISKRLKKHIRTGVRIHLNSMPQWIKFGIDIKELKHFWNLAKKYPYIHMEGIHFHASRNKNAVPYAESIKELGIYIKENFSKKERSEITYIDFGGGFEPYESEGYFPYEFSKDIADTQSTSYDDVKRRFSSIYKIREAIPLKEYASAIYFAIEQYFLPYISARYYAEPGRIICNNSMHIVLSVADIKGDGVCILDGGINMVGWQRYMYEYFPVINLSHPAKTDIPYTLYGKLCTTRDLWGYSCYAKHMKVGDTIIIPNQGALTYSIAQNWILKIPKVHIL